MCVVLCISLGLFLFTFESTQFNATGFIMCLTASIISGLRWSLTQLIAQKDELGMYSLYCSLCIPSSKSGLTLLPPHPTFSTLFSHTFRFWPFQAWSMVLQWFFIREIVRVRVVHASLLLWIIFILNCQHILKLAAVHTLFTIIMLRGNECSSKKKNLKSDYTLNYLFSFNAGPNVWFFKQMSWVFQTLLILFRML